MYELQDKLLILITETYVNFDDDADRVFEAPVLEPDIIKRLLLFIVCVSQNIISLFLTHP